MAWQNPKTDWSVEPVHFDDFNRIENNILELKKAATIEIDDIGGFFNSNNIEGALQELYLLSR